MLFFKTYNFKHRCEWILERLKLLAQMFAIDSAAFALMSNHYPLVVQVDAVKAATWNAKEITDRFSPCNNKQASMLAGLFIYAVLFSCTYSVSKRL